MNSTQNDESRGFPLIGGDSVPTADELASTRREAWNPLPEDETSRIAREHEAAFAALPEAEQTRQYARFERDTAGAWLGTYS